MDSLQERISCLTSVRLVSLRNRKFGDLVIGATIEGESTGIINHQVTRRRFLITSEPLIKQESELHTSVTS